MFGSNKKKGSMCDFCTVTNLVISAFAVLTTLAGLIGVYKAHVLSTGIAFGTTSGSLSLLALAINLFLLKKALENCSCAFTGSKK